MSVRGLSARQLETVRLAFVLGYYRYPRECEGRDIAKQLGVTPSTVHDHLRKAEQRIMRNLFANETEGRGSE